jgi:hypothetical protein
MRQLLAHTRISLVLLILFSVQTQAGSDGTSYLGGLAGAPFRLGFAARGIGMGNALTAVPFGNVNSYYNPALLPYQSLPTVLLSYGSLTLDRRLNFLSYTQHLNPDAGLSVGLINAGVGNIDGRDIDGQPTQTYSTSENQFFFSFGLMPDKKFSFGVTAKVLYYNLYTDVRSTTVGLDIGTLYSISDELKFAFVLQDVLSKYKWDTSKLYGESGSSYVDNFPLRKRLGLSYISREWGMIASGEIEWIGPEPYARFGTELELFSGLQIRGGIDQISFSGDVAAKPSVGFSVQTEVASWNPRIDYAYVFEPYIASGMHYLTLSLSFQ